MQIYVQLLISNHFNVHIFKKFEQTQTVNIHNEHKPTICSDFIFFFDSSTSIKPNDSALRSVPVLRLRQAYYALARVELNLQSGSLG